MTRPRTCLILLGLLAAPLAQALSPPAPPQVPAQVSNVAWAADMASFDTHHVIDPYLKFGHYLGLAMHAPAAYQLLLWLTGLPGTTVERHRSPPHGHWILLGFGSFSQGLAATIASEGMPVTVIDLQPPAASSAQVSWVQGDGTGAEALLKAGVAQAAGIVAATSSDVDNLSATFTARELNPGLFTIVRQNNMGNRPLFERFAADLTMVPSEVIAHECLAILTTPMLAPFLRLAQTADWCESLLQRLTAQLGWEAPEVWSVRISAQHAPALHHKLKLDDSLRLGDIELRDVAALIAPGMDGDDVLLGMSALKQLEFSQKGGTLVLRQSTLQ